MNTYSLPKHTAETLMGAVLMEPGLRREVLTKLLGDRDEVIDVLVQFIGLANSVVENNREMIELVLITEGGMHPHSAEKANLPTIWGALNGIRIAEGVKQDTTCVGCAFRLGTPANQSPSTTCDGEFVAHPGEGEFLCHVDGLDDRGEPTKACAGWAQTRARLNRRAA